MSPDLGRILVVVGVIVVIVGLLVMFGVRLGRLPGDIVIEGERGGIFIPIVTMLLISLVLTVVLNVIFRR